MSNAKSSKAVQLLSAMKTLNASDLHLKTGVPPIYRVSGILKSANVPPLTEEEISAVIASIIPKGREAEFEERGGLDFATELPDGDRFRINAFRASTHMHAAIRRVNSRIPSFEELHLPPVYRQVIDQTNEGIIIVCGVTGSGKSTTIAAMVEHVNNSTHDNIITIEDPVEFQFKSKKSIISQREIGIDVPTFAEALRHVVRQNPDTIVIGEMRDRPTMTAALQAAETGHLVLCTLHTADTMQAFARILEFFPTEEHALMRASLANSLRAICAQRLMPGAHDEVPLVPATEVLINNAVCRDLIRKDQDKDLPALIEGSEREGMHSFTSSLARLVGEDMVFMDVAMQFAPNAEALASQLRGIKTRASTMVQRR